MQSYGWIENWRYGTCSKLDLFESWLELKTSPLFQLHRFSNGLLAILKRGQYRVGTTGVRAVQVSPGRHEGDRKVVDGSAECLAIKVPSTPEIRRRAGLLVKAFADQPAPVDAPPAVQPDLLDPLLAVPQAQPPARVAGLYMVEGTRVLSITPYNVRLVATGRIVEAYNWGHRDQRNPGGGAAPPEDDVNALVGLIR